VNQQHLTYAQCNTALQNAQSRFADLRKKYPHMKAYLVLALRGMQTEDIQSWESILRTFPQFISGGPDADTLRQLIRAPKPKDPSIEELAQHRNHFQHCAQTTTYHPDALIELRFHDLDYPLLDQLRQDPLIDQTLTPQTRASIRIVLGTMKSFYLT
jgi:hypothetical protein